MPRLSIIVTGSDIDERFEDTLASVLRNRPADCEVLAATRDEYPDPYGIGDEVSFHCSPQGTGTLLDALNQAVEAGQGEVIHVLDAGIEVAEGWTEAALARFDDPNVAAVAPLIMTAERPEQIETAGVRYGAGGSRREEGKNRIPRGDRPTAWRIDGPCLRAAFYRKQALREASGFESSVGHELADVDIATTFKAVGYRCVSEPACRVIAAAPASRPPLGFSTGLRTQRLFLRHLRTVGLFKGLSMLPLAALTQTLGGSPLSGWGHLLGRSVGCLEFRRLARYRRMLRQWNATPRLRVYGEQEAMAGTRPSVRPGSRRAA